MSNKLCYGLIPHFAQFGAIERVQELEGLLGVTELMPPAEAQAAAEERANAQALSDAYVKTQKAPEQGSGAELIGELTQQAMGG